MKATVLALLALLSLSPLRAQDAAAPRTPHRAAPPLDPRLPTLFVVGDSTAADNGTPLAVGWGIPFTGFFDTTKINVANRARGGRSSRTFITEGLWDKVRHELKPGDIVLLQFGHNDAGAINDASRARGSVHSLGEETVEIDNLLTKKHEIVHTFGWYMRKMITETKAAGATPVVLGLTVRDIWQGGKVERGPEDYSVLSAQVARSQQISFLDLTSLIADRYEREGQARAHAYFPRDHTHTNLAGATINATLVVSALKQLPGLGLADKFSAQGRAVAAAPPPRAAEVPGGPR
jgi:lysophospholipase L1-like esterase